MTLIAAIRCDEGIAICADSQETIGEYRRTVQKITPFEFDNCRAILTGAGNGDLVETFVVFLQDHMSDIAVTNLAHFSAEVETCLKEFYREVMRLPPGLTQTVKTQLTVR